MFDHPSKHELMEYAESLSRNGAAGVSPRIGRHVGSCASCGRQVRAMRQSIELFGRLPRVEPSTAAARKIMTAARTEMRRSPSLGKRAAAGFLQAAAFAATVTAASVVVFGAALDAAEHRATRPDAAQAASQASEREQRAESLAALEEARLRIKAYRGAVQSRLDEDAPDDLEERVRLRAMRGALYAREAEMSEAAEALEQNPGCLRASETLTTNLVRHAEELEAMYTGASL